MGGTRTLLICKGPLYTHLHRHHHPPIITHVIISQYRIVFSQSFTVQFHIHYSGSLLHSTCCSFISRSLLLHPSRRNHPPGRWYQMSGQGIRSLHKIRLWQVTVHVFGPSRDLLCLVSCNSHRTRLSCHSLSEDLNTFGQQVQQFETNEIIWGFFGQCL